MVRLGFPGVPGRSLAEALAWPGRRFDRDWPTDLMGGGLTVSPPLAGPAPANPPASPAPAPARRRRLYPRAGCGGPRTAAASSAAAAAARVLPRRIRPRGRSRRRSPPSLITPVAAPRWD